MMLKSNMKKGKPEIAKPKDSIKTGKPKIAGFSFYQVELGV